MMDFFQLMASYLSYCKEQKGLSKNTIRAYKVDLVQFLNFLGCAVFNKALIESYIHKISSEYEPKSIKRKLASLKAFCVWLVENGALKENPCLKIRFNRKDSYILPRLIPKDLIQDLFNYMYKCSRDKAKLPLYRYILRDIAVVEFLYSTGARVCEVSNLLLKNIDLNTGMITLMGKGQVERRVQITNPDALKAVNTYYKANEEAIRNSGYFFVNRDGDRFSEQSIRNMIKKYTRLAGIKLNITPHMFRHSFATQLIENGADALSVQKLLGHKSIKTTQIYVELSFVALRKVLETCSPRNTLNVEIPV